MSFQKVPLGEVCDITMGQAPVGSSYNENSEGLALIAGAGDFGQTTPEPKKFTTQASKISKINDLILCIRATIGDLNWSDKEYCLGRGVAGLRPIDRVLDKSYLWHFIVANKSQLAAKGTGSTFKQVSRSHIGEWEIPLPSLPEQKRIAAILDKADAIRRKRQQAILLADEFLRAVFLDMFGDPVTNPKRWTIRSIDEVCTEIVDCVNRTAPTVDYSTPYKMIRTTNVRNYSLDVGNVRYVDEETYSKWTRRLEPKIGDLIFTREAPAGEAAVVRTEEKLFLGQRTMHFRPDPNKIVSDYLMYELMAGGVKRQINKMHAGSTVTHLSVPECKKFIVRVPPLAIQEKFNDIRKIVLRLGGARLKTSELPLFEAISQKAFSGRL